MAKQSGFLRAIQAEQARREADVRHHARVFQMDMVTIAEYCDDFEPKEG